MKKSIVFSAIVLMVSLAGLIVCSPKTSPQASQPLTWSCPMHPEVVSDKPGTCPKCGMELVQGDGKGKHNHKGCKMNSGGNHDHSGGGCGMMQ